MNPKARHCCGQIHAFVGERCNEFIGAPRLLLKTLCAVLFSHRMVRRSVEAIHLSGHFFRDFRGVNRPNA